MAPLLQSQRGNFSGQAGESVKGEKGENLKSQSSDLRDSGFRVKHGMTNRRNDGHNGRG